MKSIYEAQVRNLPFRNARAKEKKLASEKNHQTDKKVRGRLKTMKVEKEQDELKSVYPPEYEPPQISLEEASRADETRKMPEPLSSVAMKSIEEEETADCVDYSRIVRSSMGVRSATIHEYVPATKLKGLDDWVLESSHYDYYSRGADFSVHVEKDPVLRFPEHLKVYAFEALNDSKFPSPRRGPLGVYDFYLMDGASILPVLALDLQPGDAVLDMCAAPGGKSLAALQTLMPRVLIANDVQLSRVNRFNKVIDEYFGGLNVWENRLFVTQKDARIVDDADMFNKVIHKKKTIKKKNLFLRLTIFFFFSRFWSMFPARPTATCSTKTTTTSSNRRDFGSDSSCRNCRRKYWRKPWKSSHLAAPSFIPLALSAPYKTMELFKWPWKKRGNRLNRQWWSCKFCGIVKTLESLTIESLRNIRWR